VWKISQDAPDATLIAAPGNPGIARHARCVQVRATDIADLTRLALEEKVDLVVVGPEGPLEAGLVDRLRAEKIAAFGPTRGAARIETSKRFAKQLMLAAGVPTAKATFHDNAADARRAVKAMPAPLVIKASGLAAGKGVIVCQTREDADRAIELIVEQRAFGDAGSEVLVEEFMEGEELSLFAICDGHRVVPLLAAQDHKRLLENDEGPNTGGMGAYAPVSLATDDLVSRAVDEIFEPVLDSLMKAGAPFHGLLYAGLMLTDEGPKVVEFNCRFGDPETEAILPLMESSLLELLTAVGKEGSLAGVTSPRWKTASAVTTVVAAAGYPESPWGGDTISLPAEREGVFVFHAGTRTSATGELETAGGRVIAVTGVAPDFAAARALSSDTAAMVKFRGQQFRQDIGWREAARRAGTS
jgi:phosphoribosylamine---glycine ligase